jgi:hypothetical protein
MSSVSLGPPTHTDKLARCLSLLACGLTRLEPWRESMRRLVGETLESGGDVWVTRRLWRPKPRPEWLWVDDQASEVRWAAVQAFFMQLETAESVGGDDGYVRRRPIRHASRCDGTKLQLRRGDAQIAAPLP